MTNTKNQLSINEVKSRALQIITHMSETDRQRLLSLIFAIQNEAENKKCLFMIIASLPEAILRNLSDQLEDWHKFKLIELRKDPRKPSFISTECSTGDTRFTDFIQDISNGGVYIQTDGSFFLGQQITLTFSIPKTREEQKVSGEIVRVDSQGIGVKFNEPLSIS